MTIYEYLETFAKGYGLKIKPFEQKCGLGNCATKSLTVNSRKSTWDKIKKAFPEFDVADMMRKCCGIEYVALDSSNENASDYITLSKSDYEELQKTIASLRRTVDFLISNSEKKVQESTPESRLA